MPRQALTTVENNFVGGLKTEFTGLNFPENSAIETENIIYDRLGRVQRRLGIDKEDTGIFNTQDRTNAAINSYVWLNAAGDGVTNLLVVQVGTKLRFFEASDPSTALSGQLLTSQIDLTTFVATGTTISSISDECQFAQGNGFLFVFHPHLEPFYVSFDTATQVVTGNVITVEIRDLAGISEGLPDVNRPTNLTDAHRYNLGNQGWRSGYKLTSTSNLTPPVGATPTAPVARVFVTNITSSATPIRNGDRIYAWSATDHTKLMIGVVTSFSGTTLTMNVISATNGVAATDWEIGQYTDEIIIWNQTSANYPSNSDVWWAFKNASDNFDPVNTINSVPLANSAAPKGHYVVSAFNIDRSPISGITGLTPVTTGGERPATGAFHSGRLFYAGIKSILQHNNVYFSQIIEGTTEFGRCYQQNDPTAEDFFDLLPTDGGVITIQGAGTILKLYSTKSAIICFATNGIWSIQGTGGEGLGFTATDYSVIKLSAIKTLSATSFVEVEGTISWWNLEGIYTLSLGNLGAQDATIASQTNTTIATFYNTIPNASKQFARGAYNPLSFIVQWIYRSTPASTISQRYEYDSFLCYNTLSKAFYTYRIATSNSGLTINGIATVETPGGTFLINNVVRGADQVVDLAGNQVIVNALSGNVTPIFKYIISKPSGVTFNMSFAEEYRTSFHDWVSEDTVGRNYDSTFTTGYAVHGEAQKFFDLNYLNVYTDSSRFTADTAYFVQGKWDFADSGDSGKWSTRQRASIPSGDFAVGRRRFRIRGRGMALQLKFDAIESFPMSIIGWSKWETKNSTP